MFPISSFWGSWGRLLGVLGCFRWFPLFFYKKSFVWDVIGRMMFTFIRLHKHFWTVCKSQDFGSFYFLLSFFWKGCFGLLGLSFLGSMLWVFLRSMCLLMVFLFWRAERLRDVWDQQEPLQGLRWCRTGFGPLVKTTGLRCFLERSPRCFWETAPQKNERSVLNSLSRPGLGMLFFFVLFFVFPLLRNVPGSFWTHVAGRTMKNKRDEESLSRVQGCSSSGCWKRKGKDVMNDVDVDLPHLIRSHAIGNLGFLLAIDLLPSFIGHLKILKCKKSSAHPTKQETFTGWNKQKNPKKHYRMFIIQSIISHFLCFKPTCSTGLRPNGTHLLPATGPVSANALVGPLVVDAASGSPVGWAWWGPVSRGSVFFCGSGHHEESGDYYFPFFSDFLCQFFIFFPFFHFFLLTRVSIFGGFYIL